jgi:ribosome maturation factor RimP
MDQYKPLITTTVEAHGASLVAIEVDTSMKPKVLRVLADAPGGITIDQCVTINRALCDVLPLDVLPGEYQIEVASPGAERELQSMQDVEQAIGKYIYCRLHKAIDKQQEITGTLLRISDETGEWVLTVKTTKLHQIPYSTIAFLRTAVKF